jgi:hypothetical protein
MKRVLLAALLFLIPALAGADPLTRVWGLYGWGDNWRGSSSGVDEIAVKARQIPGVEFVHIFNYYQTQEVFDEIRAAPTDTKIAIYGYSCGANAMTVIAKGLNGIRKVDTLAGIQESLWCGGDPLFANVVYGQVTYGGCGQTLGLGCKQLEAGDGFEGTILNISRPERHGPADNDPAYQQDVLDAIGETAAPPPPESPGWEHFGHGHALARQGLATMLRGAILFKKGVHEIVCYHEGCQ